MHATIAHLLTRYGYVFLFLLVGIESFGVPLPGESALVTASAYAALGKLSIVGVIVAAACGAIVGDNAGYWLGREGGVALVRRYGRRVGLDQAKLDRAHAFFARNGAKTVFIGRFVALLRSWAAALAGVACMPYGTFTLWNALGGVIWSSAFGALGYAFGHNLPRLERYAGQVSVALVLLAALGVAIVLSLRWFHDHRDAVGARASAWRERVVTSPRVTHLHERHPALWSWVGARFARGEYLGLHLTVGFVLSVAALWLFGGVTEDVVHHDPLTIIDLQFATWLRAHAVPLADQIARVVSDIGSPVAMAVLAAIVAIVLARRRAWIVLTGWSAAFAGGGILTWLLKRIVQRPRPLGAKAFLFDTSFSFPSGHAMGSLLGYGMLAYLLMVSWPKARGHRTAVGVSALALVLLIGFSRLYLGVHYLSDVIAGYAAGLLWLAACVTGIDIALRQSVRARPDIASVPRPALRARDANPS